MPKVITVNPNCYAAEEFVGWLIGQGYHARVGQRFAGLHFVDGEECVMGSEAERIFDELYETFCLLQDY